MSASGPQRIFAVQRSRDVETPHVLQVPLLVRSCFGELSVGAGRLRATRLHAQRNKALSRHQMTPDHALLAALARGRVRLTYVLFNQRLFIHVSRLARYDRVDRRRAGDGAEEHVGMQSKFSRDWTSGSRWSDNGHFRFKEELMPDHAQQPT